jgi:hypothetical protein
MVIVISYFYPLAALCYPGIVLGALLLMKGPVFDKLILALVYPLVLIGWRVFFCLVVGGAGSFLMLSGLWLVLLVLFVVCVVVCC